MNKKIFSFILAIMLILGMFTGCDLFNKDKAEDGENVSNEENKNQIDDSAMTLSLWIPTENGTSEEAIKLVEAEINKITTGMFNTAIELHAIPQSQYQKAVDARLAEVKIAREKKLEDESKLAETQETTESSETEETEEETDETYVNDLGITVIKYPDVEEDQMDIFLIQGKANYDRYISESAIQTLAAELSTNSKSLTKFIYPTFLELVKSTGAFAIPNNHPVGEYKYLLVNKELVDKYDYNPDKLTTLLDCSTFIKDIGYQNLSGVTPLLGKVEPNMVYWSSNDTTEWSVIASLLPSNMTSSSKCTPMNIFSNKEYVNTIGMMKELEELGYIGNGKISDNAKFAVGVVSGDGRVVEQYGDEYYIHIYSKPVFEEEEAYESMFAVSSYSKNLARSMQIVTYLNTNENFRTLLQYGVQDVHWEYEDSTKDTIRMISNEYNMDLYKTGNVFMTYPGEGQSMDIWEYSKQQNLDSSLSPLYKFKGVVNDNNKELAKQIADLSASYKAKLDSLTAAEYLEAVAQMEAELNENEAVKQLTDASNKNSFVAVYESWYKSNFKTK